MLNIQFELKKLEPTMLDGDMLVRRYYLNEEVDTDEGDAGYFLAHYVGELVDSIVRSLEDDEEGIDIFRWHLISLVRLAGKE